MSKNVDFSILWGNAANASIVHTFYFYFLGHCVSTSNSNTDGGAGYVSPRPGSTIQCGCQNGSTQYQNLTDHSCEEQASTSSVA